MEPIRFNREKDAREAAIKERLIDIRTAQETFKAVKGYYTGSFDTLITSLPPTPAAHFPPWLTD